MAEFWILLLSVGFVSAALIYLIALRINLWAVVDLIWTGGVGFAAIAYLSVSGHISFRTIIITSLIAIWSLRLTVHLFSDRIVPGREDSRYVYLSNYWGASAKRNFFGLFLAQIVLVALFVWPISIAIDADVERWNWGDSMGVLIAAVALIGEFVADKQLAHFRASDGNQSAVCREGLWRYSRHPNYFFEWLHWWAYVAFSLSTSWWLALSGPIAIYIFLRYLTGIPHAERSSLKRRGNAYLHYQQTTSIFFPWIPREPKPQIVK